MRKLMLLGTTIAAVALGAANAFAVPQNSPYAIMAPPDAVDGYGYDQGPGYDNGYGDSGVIEGRSAYIDPDYGYADPGYAYEQGPVGGFYFGGGGGHRGGGNWGGGHGGGGHWGGGHGGGGHRSR